MSVLQLDFDVSDGILKLSNRSLNISDLFPLLIDPALNRPFKFPRSGITLQITAVIDSALDIRNHIPEPVDALKLARFGVPEFCLPFVLFPLPLLVTVFLNAGRPTMPRPIPC